MPAPPGEIGKREFDPSVDLLRAHARRQRGIRKVHTRWIKTDQQDTFHRPSSEHTSSRPRPRSQVCDRNGSNRIAGLITSILFITHQVLVVVHPPVVQRIRYCRTTDSEDSLCVAAK